MKESIIVKQIRELRIQSGFTQAEVSRKLNIQRQTYSNYENATRTPPLEVIAALADLYHVTVDYLVRGPRPKERASDANALTREERKLLKEFKSLNTNNRKEVLHFITFKRKFPD